MYSELRTGPYSIELVRLDTRDCQSGSAFVITSRYMEVVRM